MTMLRRAERLLNGRVKGVGPPQLQPRVVATMSVDTRLKLMALFERQNETKRQIVALIASCGLDPRKQYRFDKNGDVVEIGNWKPVYD